MATTNTIQGTVNWCKAYILNRPSIGVAGFNGEPALTNANLIMSTILAPPFAWQWNRVSKTFNTVVGQADYFISLPDFGWLEKAVLSITNGTPPNVEIQIVPSLTISGKQSRPFQIAVQQDDNNGNITFRLLALPDQIYTVTLIYQKSPIFATSLYGPAYTLTSVAAASGGTTVYTGTIVAAANSLAGTYFNVSGFASSLNNGTFLCTANNGTTTVTLSNQYGVAVTAAGSAAPATTTWAPIPDKYNFLYERAMLAHLHGMYDMATYAMELQLFFKQLVGCSEGLSETAKAIFLEDRLAQLRTESAVVGATSASPRRGQ